VIAEDESAARASLDKAKKIYGGHMGARSRSTASGARPIA
jgi:hypothetical protein